MVLSDEEVRMKAIEISANIAARTVAAAISRGVSVNEYNIFAMCDDIETYIRTGKMAEPIKTKRTLF